MSVLGKNDSPPNSPWPKKSIELTFEEEKIKEQIYVDVQKWGYKGIFGWAQSLGHRHIHKLAQTLEKKDGRLMTLEIGCGSGSHFRFADKYNYFGLDMRASLLRSARDLSPAAKLIQGDAYHLPFANSPFDCVVSLYVFEHLSNLPKCLAEVKRILKPGGALLVGLPAEGGLSYDVARRLTSKRRYESKFNVDYLRLVRSEHCNTCQEVIDELDRWFGIDSVRYLPFWISSVHINVAVVVHCSNSRKL